MMSDFLCVTQPRNLVCVAETLTGRVPTDRLGLSIVTLVAASVSADTPWAGPAFSACCSLVLTAVLLLGRLKTGTDKELQVLAVALCCTPQIPQKAVRMFVLCSAELQGSAASALGFLPHLPYLQTKLK